MKWFKHDTDAITDAKIRKLIMRYGAVGYAIYFHCIELIAGDVCETNITFQLEHDAEIIADNLRIAGDTTKSGAEKVMEIMAYMVQLRLFESSMGRIFCFKLLKRIDTSMLSPNSCMRRLITQAKEEYGKSDGLVMTESCYTIQDKTIQDYTILEETKLEESPRKREHGKFVKPSLDEVQAYCDERANGIKAHAFIDYYDAVGWMVGKKPMRDWKACVRTWESKARPADTADLSKLNV